ncbi:MAG TPA: PQQ-binding-like beta-propeller repeat protein [Rhizomicrobium sp.]|jgi:outer membrane protein assembly factor BamB
MKRKDRVRNALLATLALLAAAGVAACSTEWPEFRQNIFRTGSQFNNGPLADPQKVQSLAVKWTFPGSAGVNLNPAPGPFYAAPIVFKDTVYIGNSNGFFYAIDATTGALKWQFPAKGSQPLTSTFTCNPSSMGIASSADVAVIGDTAAVVFGAPDMSIGTGLGSGRLFALNAATGAVVWKSPEIARLRSDGVTHEQIGYSAPTVYGQDVYVGIADHCDDPIQQGKLVAVHQSDGTIDTAFSFMSTGPPYGGGIWGTPAAWIGALIVTTGNVNEGQPEPSPDHALSMVELNSISGSVIWAWQPVPYDLDFDPDWTSTPSVMTASCGTFAVSTQKDGWTWAVNVGNGTPGPPSVQWAFPTGSWFPGGFHSGDGTSHNDTRYLRPGAVWDDVYIVQTGGLDVTTDVYDGFKHLYALNACASDPNRIRWIANVPNSSGGEGSIGPPSVTFGIVYVGTDLGHLVIFADPSIAAPDGYQCSDPDVSTLPCVPFGFTLVPEPHVVNDINLGAGEISTEPVLADNRVYVSTGNGNVIMLAPP